MRPSPSAKRLVVGLAIAALATVGCGGDDDQGSGSSGNGASSDDRPATVELVVDEVVAPAHRAAAATATAARNAVGVACPPSGAVPTEAEVESARLAVAEGNDAWEVLDPVDLGPVMDRRSTSLVGYKVDEDAVDEVLATNPPTDVETVQKRTASPRRGYGALAHLLSADPTAFPGARCAYATAVVATIDEELAAVAQEWFDTPPPYAERAAGRGADAVATDETIDSWVNMSLSTLESDLKLLADPETEASGSNAAKHHAAMIQQIWEGASDDGLGSLTSSDVDDKLRGELDAVANAADVAALTAAVEAVRSTLGTEVVSALDVTVGFSENDGDS